jgi:hypothetical protein
VLRIARYSIQKIEEKRRKKNLLQTHYKISPNPCKLLPKELPQIF